MTTYTERYGANGKEIVVNEDKEFYRGVEDNDDPFDRVVVGDYVNAEAEPTITVSSIEYETLRKSLKAVHQEADKIRKQNEHLTGMANQLRKERDDLRITLATIWSLR